MVPIQLLLAVAGIASAGPAAPPAAAAAPAPAAAPGDAVRFVPSQVTMTANGKKFLFTLTPVGPDAGPSRIWYWEPGGRKIGQRLARLIGTREEIDRPSARPLTRSTDPADHPAFTPDDAQVSFRAARDAGGRARVWVLPLDGGEAEPWTDAARDVRMYSWLPDGALAYVAGDELRIVPAGDGPEEVLHRAAHVQELVPNFDGHALAVTTVDDTSGTLWSVSRTERTVRRIASEPGLRSPAWTRDGQGLAWLAGGGPVRDRILTEDRDGIRTVHTAPAGTALRGLQGGAETPWLYFVEEGPASARLMRVRPDNGRVEPVTPEGGRVGGFAVRRDGEKAALVWTAEGAPPEVATWSFPDNYVEIRTRRNPVFPETAPREGENE